MSYWRKGEQFSDGVRVKEADSLSGGALFSAWQTIQFTLVDPVASSIHVDSLALTSDTGNSNSDGSTANPNLSGHVANSPSGGVSVEFDLNGDGLIDGTAQTNSSGNFSFTPASNLQEGYITALARVASSLPLSAPGIVAPFAAARPPRRGLGFVPAPR